MSVITSIVARIYGKRNSKRKAEQIKRCVEQHIQDEGLDEDWSAPTQTDQWGL